MNKKHLIIGFVIGILACIVGVFLFLVLVTGQGFISGIESMKSEGKLGKLVTLGAILDLAFFWILLKNDREVMARGVVLAVIFIAIVTIFL